jgi:hypothetical protein
MSALSYCCPIPWNPRMLTGLRRLTLLLAHPTCSKLNAKALLVGWPPAPPSPHQPASLNGSAWSI